MAGSFNSITLVGNLTRDPETRYLNSGSAVCKFTLAVNRRTKQDEVDFIDCVAWDKLAETCSTYLKKGMSVLVGGRLSIRPYETKEGEKRKAVEVVAQVMQMLDRRAGDALSTGAAAIETEVPAEPTAQPVYAGGAPMQFTPRGAADEDDLPF